MVRGSWICQCAGYTHTHTATCTRAHTLTCAHMVLGSRLEQTPAPLSGAVVNRWGKAQPLWQAKTQQRYSSGREKKGERERDGRSEVEKERCQLGCRWVQTLCILPDNDGSRRETMREDGGSEKKGEEGEASVWVGEKTRQQRLEVSRLIQVGIKRLTQSWVHLCQSLQTKLTEWLHDWLSDWQKSLSDNWQTVGTLTEWLAGFINHATHWLFISLITWLNMSCNNFQQYFKTAIHKITQNYDFFWLFSISLCFPREILDTYLGF